MINSTSIHHGEDDRLEEISYLGGVSRVPISPCHQSLPELERYFGNVQQAK